MYEGNMMMYALAAGIIAASLAFLANRLSYVIWKQSVIIGAAPLTEETAKTMTAWWLGAGIIHTHIVFGCIEGLLDLQAGLRVHTEKTSCVKTAVSAVAAHSIFGWVTARVAAETANLGFGILAGILLHAVWNAALLFRTTKG